MTRAADHTVLVVGHTVVSIQRLLDVVGLIEGDGRVQVVYTLAPNVFGNGAAELLRALDAMVIPWSQAIHERFDLALAAAYTGLDQLHAPVMVLPHGAGYGKRSPGWPGGDQAVTRNVYGLDAYRLIRDGRLIADSIVLSHNAQRRVLIRQCRPAARAALVAGDPCYDRMLASLSHRASYRDALGVPSDRQFVVVASTWGRHSLLSRHADLLPTLMAELTPAGFRVALLLHPAAWFGHGPRQIRSWLRDAREAGLVLIPPTTDWRAAVLAADQVIGDHGSTTVYAAAIGVPVLHVGAPTEDLDPGSPQAWLATNAQRLAHDRPLARQLIPPERHIDERLRNPVAALVTSRPGRAHQLLRERMYALVGCDMPGRHRAPDVIPVQSFEPKGLNHA